MSGSLEERVAKLERDQQELWSATSSHFIELREYIGDTLKSHFEKFGAQLDERFTTIDQRFVRIDQRFDRLESKLDLFISTQGGINRRHDRRLSALERRLRTQRRKE